MVFSITLQFGAKQIEIVSPTACYTRLFDERINRLGKRVDNTKFSLDKQEMKLQEIEERLGNQESPLGQSV